jgi:exopolyphosphatase/guanosine-5'-triphosphate,3'-diphosphate pyrophosphatase
LGTNNCRLLVAKPSRDGFRIVDAFSRIVRLGEGVSRTGRLSPDAVNRTMDALRICAAKMRRNGVTRARSVATEACRRAENRAEFISDVRAETGIELDVISTDEEAQLALEGCTSLLDPDARRAIIFDIGGGSTELIWLDLEQAGGPRALGWTSLDCGVVTLAERYGTDRLEPEVYSDMRAEVEAMLAPSVARFDFAETVGPSAIQLLGTSGTVTTVAGVHLDLERYDRSKVDGIWLETQEVRRVAGGLADMDYAARARHPCIGRGRADLAVAGCAVLEAIMGCWRAERVRVADRGLREGILRGLMAEADAEIRHG